MLTGSAITRAFVIVVLAAGLAGLWQSFFGRAAPDRAALAAAIPAAPIPAAAKMTAAAAPQGGEEAAPVRSVYPGPAPQAPAAPAPAAPAAALLGAESRPLAPPFGGPPAPPPAIEAPAEPAAAAPPPVFPEPTRVASAEDPPPAAAAEPSPAPGGIDLNTATLAELNGLRGGGRIGKAIIAGRPYASPGDLLAKRVVSRAVFERIKDQVAVR
ncbi:helix-hairpin-helix domain-containing protein [Methylobacterium sp. WSM2598]|uniref:helix-hairpin-helix domain-containing protein n=1 Tax=Methylobacterium sp. WSM2598 TaxID=398261 RepID=UPI000380E0D8|nr:helix-hairpin-helix domain-containing protein [Methylobacterium sp. WSM2598]